MRALFIILFLTDTLIMVLLAFFFLARLDAGMNMKTLALLLTAIIMAILLLVYLLYRFLHLPPDPPAD